jgi:hypothetical protein
MSSLLEQVGSRFYLGLDLGQAQDYSAIAVAERRIELTGTRDPVTYANHTRMRVLVRHLERLPLRTSYPDVVTRVRDVVQKFQGLKLEIYVDATGVGNAVHDMLHAARLGVHVFGVIITGGERVSFSYGSYHVPRHDLLANLRILLEQRTLEIAVRGGAAEALRTELHRWGRRSAHDDLVFAVALACWKAGGQLFPLFGPSPVPLITPEIRK